MLTNEVVFLKDYMELKSFEDILRNLKSAEIYLFDFTRVEKIDSNLDACGKVFQEIVDKCARVVLIGPSLFQPLVDLVNQERFLFIVRSKFDTHVEFTYETVDLIKNISIEYFKRQFGDLNFKDVSNVPALSLSSKIKISLLGDKYDYTVLMTDDFFRQACLKVLHINVDECYEGYSDLISEFLNLLSVHLRSGIIPEALKLKVAMPINRPRVTQAELASENKVFAFMSQNEDVAFLFSKEN